MNAAITAVLDIGKTRLKFSVLDEDGQVLSRADAPNTTCSSGRYPASDLERTWSFFLHALKEAAAIFRIAKIAVSAHGAAGVLVDPSSGRPLLPMLDYEHPLPNDVSRAYDAIRPAFTETGSPRLPLGLNLGAQLFWLARQLSDDEKRRAVLLLHPSYWAFRLTGKASAEVTSLGCHSDLWDIRRGAPSPVLDALGLGDALPELVSPLTPLATISDEVAAATGLRRETVVMPGLHDSNASYIPTLAVPRAKRPVMISTGTWVVTMAPSSSTDHLREDHDMLVFVDAEGERLPAARFMGGREYGEICSRLGSAVDAPCTRDHVLDAIASSALPIPSFAKGAGPFPGGEGRIVGSGYGPAIASLYAALMMDHVLTSLRTEGRPVLIEGPFAGNVYITELLASLRRDTNTVAAAPQSGVAHGCFMAANWGAVETPRQPPPIAADRFDISAFADQWRTLVAGGG